MKRIVVAEDNEANLELIRAILETRGFEVIEAHDGEEAIAKIRETGPDLVLMDVQMPLLNGVGALQKLRREPGLAAIPVIALTAYAMCGDKEDFLAAGFDSYVSKPIEPSTLWRQVRELLDDERMS